MLIVFSLLPWDVFPQHQNIGDYTFYRNHCRHQPPTQARCRRRRTWWSSLFPSSPSPPLLALASPVPAGIWSPLLSAWWFTTGEPLSRYSLYWTKWLPRMLNLFIKAEMWLVKMWLSGKGSTCRPAVWSLTRRAKPRGRLIMYFPLRRWASRSRYWSSCCSFVLSIWYFCYW